MFMADDANSGVFFSEQGKLEHRTKEVGSFFLAGNMMLK